MRAFLLLLATLCGFAEDFPLGFAPLGTSANGGMGIEAPLGLGAGRTVAQAMTAAAFTNLNDPAIATFSRTTGAWDPVNNVIKYPNQRRQRNFVVAGTTYAADLIESARTNLLAAGTSEHFERWTVGSGTPVVTTDTIACPNAEVVADTLTEGVGTGTQGVSQSITKAASSITYAGSCYVKNKTGSREVAVDLDDGTLTNGVQMRINPATGALTAAPAAFGTGWSSNTTAGTSGYTITDAGSGWYRVTIIANSDSTTTVRFRVALYNAADSYAGNGTSAVYLWGANVDAATFAASTCLCRNLLLQSETLGTSWTATRSTITSNTTADPITGNLTADTINDDNTATNTHFITQSFTKAASSLQFTYTTYIKQGGRTWCLVMCADTAVLGGTNGAGTYFDVANGVKGTTVTVGAGWTLNASSITAVGSWYRVSITVTTAATTTIACQVGGATGDNGKTYSGAGAAALICWGNQLEYGARVNQYWATTSAGLRTADVLLSTLTGITDARTNLLTWSEQFDNAAWTKTDVTVTADAGVNPTGVTSADLLTEGVAGTALTTSSVGTISPANSTVAASCWFNASTGNTWERIRVASDAGANGWNAWYNISAGTVGSQTAIGTGTASSISIANYGNGWYRCMSTGKVDAAATTLTVSCASASADASTTPVSSSAYYSFGAQLDRASTVGDYMPVGGTAITTAQTGISRTSGTFVAVVLPRNWTADQDGATAWRIYSTNSTSTDRIDRLSTGGMRSTRTPTSTTKIANTTSTLSNGALTVLAQAWWESGTEIYFNGAGGTSAATAGWPWDAATTVSIGATNTGTLADFSYNLIFYSHQQVIPGSDLALMYANTTAP